MSIPRPKTATRKDLVAKNKHFSPKSGDENGPRRQKQAFLNQKWRRERASSIY
ncbi:hypothetical protein QPM05_16080 [Caldibacillus thermoamylovorans]|nr:hypothetical protein [Caldibacillus thermoamylovorans]